MIESSPSRLYVIGAAIILTLAFQFYLWPHVVDDAYISFRYSYHLATGQGLVFNPGEHVEGFSNPLWTLVLAGLYALSGIPLPELARVVGLLCALGTLVAIWHVCRLWVPRRVAPLILSLLMLILTPGFHVYATAGLEGPLLSLLIIVGVALSFDPSRGSPLLASLFFGLVGITRPEGPLYALLWFLATLKPATPFIRMAKAEWLRFLVMILPILGWEIFRLAYYGAWLPNTALAKMPGVYAEIITLPDYVSPWIIAVGGPLIILLWMLAPPPDQTGRTLERICLALVGANLVFVVYARGDWMTFGRFIVPVWPVVALIFGRWTENGAEQLLKSGKVRLKRFLPVIPILGIIACAVLAWRSSVESYIQNKGMNMLMRGTDQLAVGSWIAANISPKATIATGRLGGISYVAISNVVWDWFGLTDAEEARYIRSGRPGTLTDDPVFRRRPDVIAAIDAPADWSYKRTKQLLEFLKESYIFVIGFPQGTYGYVDLWIRKDRIADVLLTRNQLVLPGL